MNEPRICSAHRDGEDPACRICCPATADRVTAYLAEARERGRVLAQTKSPSWGTVPRIRAVIADASKLADAVEAVLALHGPGRIALVGRLCKRHENHRHFSITSVEAADVVRCPDCTATVYDSCAGCGTQTRLAQCPVRSAITTALLGGSDD